MEKEYFVSFGFIPECSHSYTLNSIRVKTLEMRVKDLTPGQLAQYLEEEVSDMIDNISVVILNYWEM